MILDTFVIIVFELPKALSMIVQLNLAASPRTPVDELRSSEVNLWPKVEIHSLGELCGSCISCVSPQVLHLFSERKLEFARRLARREAAGEGPGLVESR